MTGTSSTRSSAELRSAILLRNAPPERTRVPPHPTPETPMIQQRSKSWLDSVQEKIIDPDRRIIDAHHHLWRTGIIYQVEDLWADTETGHNIEKTVFVDCHAEYRATGPEHLKCLGETEFVVEQAKRSQAAKNGEPVVAAIVSSADLTM